MLTARNLARLRRISLRLLALLLLVQVVALGAMLTASGPLNLYVRILLAADIMVLVVGAGLAYSAWQMRTRARTRAYRRAQPALTRAEPRSTLDLPRETSASEPDTVSGVLQELAHKAQHDGLTGLPNRSFAMDRLQEAIDRAMQHEHSLAVMFLDLNGFKPLNDTYGHHFGDNVLRKTAERLRRSVRETDTIARLGGDEFLLIMEHADANRALATAQALSAIVSQPLAGPQQPVSVGMSVGIAMYPLHGTSPRQLVSVADAAMYQSKRGDRQPVLASAEAYGATSASGRFNETTSTNLKLLDTWEGTMRGLRALMRD